MKKHLFIMGMPRGGTTVTMDLFQYVPGITLLDETPLDELENVINSGAQVVWKSPHQCLNGKILAERFPDAVLAYIIKDGREILASHVRYIDKYGIDPSFHPYLNTDGFAILWNFFAYQVKTNPFFWFRLEDLVSRAGYQIVDRLFHKLTEKLPPISTVQFWKNHIRDGNGKYPRKAVRITNGERWQDVLGNSGVKLLDEKLLKGFKYV